MQMNKKNRTFSFLNCFPRLCVVLATCHLGLISITSSTLSSHPVRDLKVAFFSDGALIFGKNRFDHPAVEFLKGWDELVSYLSQNTLYISEKGHEGVTQSSYFSPTQIGIKHNQNLNYYAVLWYRHESHNAFGFLHTHSLPMVIHTPDISSAKIVMRALQNGDIYPSHFGFALKLEHL